MVVLKKSRGASLTGYGLIVGLIAILAIVAVSDVGTQVSVMFDSVGTEMDDASAGLIGEPAGPSVPANTAAPVASGDAEVGATLSVTDGSWSGSPAPSFTYQWFKDGGPAVAISGATSSTYTPQVSDIGADIFCRVTATNAEGTATADSNVISNIQPALPYLDGIVSSVIFDLDATVSDSYSGSGTTWANLIASPADGSAQTDYDFYLGDGSNSFSYPTFTGSAGDPAAYFAFDGSDYFLIQSGTGQPAFIKNIHKTDQTSLEFWMAAVFYWPSAVTSGQYGFMGNASSSSDNGFNWRYERGNNKGSFRHLSGSSATSTNVGGALHVNDDWSIVIFSFQKTGATTGTWRRWVNSGTSSTGTFTSFGTTTTDPTFATSLFSYRTFTGEFPSGSRGVSFAMGNEFLDDTQAAQIIAHMEGRHARDYTP